MKVRPGDWRDRRSLGPVGGDLIGSSVQICLGMASAIWSRNPPFVIAFDGLSTN
jgi:hypothetical protein